MLKKINLLDLDRRMLENFFCSIHEREFRSKQIMKWIYHHYCNNFENMKNISQNLKNKLKSIAVIYTPPITEEFISSDGTIKWITSINKQKIETVYIPNEHRSTICISSQIGCPVQCTFCLTAKQGFNRNLKVSEIVGQIWNVKKMIQNRKDINFLNIKNIVMMGMGEPLLNIKNLIPSINIISDSLGFKISKRNITISTSGIIPGIKMLKQISGISLSISLHSPYDTIRNRIMPINKRYNIKNLLSASKNYVKHSKGKKVLTIEYVMIDGINDKLQHAYKLISILNKKICKINLIPLNAFPGIKYKCSSQKNIKTFSKILKKYGFTTTIRKVRGLDIGAACGQLKGLVNNKFIRTNTNMY